MNIYYGGDVAVFHVSLYVADGLLVLEGLEVVDGQTCSVE